MRLFVYTLFRLGLVLAAAGLLYLLGLRSWVLWVAAVVVGALVSFLVLARQREEAAKVLAQYHPLTEARPTFSPQVEADAAYEDAIVDAGGPRQPGDGGDEGGSAVSEPRRDGAAAAQTQDGAERPAGETPAGGTPAGELSAGERPTGQPAAEEPPAHETGDGGTHSATG